MEQTTYFISYTTSSDSDYAWAKWVSWVLENKLNAKTIIQEYDFHLWYNFREHMHYALRRADAVVCVLTRAYLESANCTDGWTDAARIIPVRFDDSAPPGLLTSRLYIDLFGLDRDSARDRLVTQIKGAARPANEPDAPFTSSGAQTGEPEFPVPHSGDGCVTRHNLPTRNKYFIGRDDMLSKIYTRLQSSATVSVIGAGGFGKTQIAIEYAYRHVSEYELIWYFNAESEKRLQDDYREFAICNLGLAGEIEQDFSKVHRAINALFMANTSFLLIYDNVESCQNIMAYIPYGQNGQTKKHILINSREQLQAGIVAERLYATVFSAKDAADFLHKRIPDADIDDAKELAHALGYLPLALECAVAYIEENQYTLSKYLELWQTRKVEVLNTHATATGYKQTILTTWITTFERITKEAQREDMAKAALQLFKLCTYCAPDDIPLKMFIEGRDETPQPLRNILGSNDDLMYNDLLSILKRYSLISWRHVNDGDVFITIHRLIQEVANHGSEQSKGGVDCCLRIAGSIFSYQYGTREDYDAFTINLPHVLEIARHAESLLDDDGSRLKVAGIYNEAGKGLQYLGDYAKALEWFCKSLAIYEEVLGAEHPAAAASYNNIAAAYHDQGDYAKALDWYYKSLAIYEEVLGAEHPDTAMSYNNIALVYKSQGEYAKALKCYYKALAIREEVLGAEHPDTAYTYSNIAGVCHSLGDYGKALEWNNKALAINEKVLGTEHPDTATTYNNIAGVCQSLGEYAKALEWHYKALAIREKVLGTKHPDTAASYNNIAVLYHDQRDYAKALEWYYKALAIHEKVLGAEHPYTAATYNNIAGVYKGQGDCAKALEWYYKALAICEKSLGAEHPYTATTYNNIALVYKDQGDYAKALGWFHKALAMYEIVLGAEHPDTATMYINIAGMYQFQGDYAKALEWYYKALAIREKVLGAEHPSTATTYNNIAGVYFSLYKFSEARDLFCRAFIILVICKLADQPLAESSFDAMRVCYEEEGGKEENFDAWIKERMETYPMWCEENS